MFRSFWRCRWSVGRGDTPVTGGSQILGFEEDSIDTFLRLLNLLLLLGVRRVTNLILADHPAHLTWGTD